MNNKTIDGVPRELVRENIAYLRGIGGTHDQKSALAAKFELLLLDPAPPKDLRANYEAWADTNGYDITRNEHGDYAGIVEDSMWTGWQARGELRALLDAPTDGPLIDEGSTPTPHTQGEPVAHCFLRRNGAGEWVNDAKSWTDGSPCQEILAECEKHPELYRVRMAYAEQPAPVAANHCVLHRGEPCQCNTDRPAPAAAVLAEARTWLGDGLNSDGLAQEHWTPEYAALIERIDATLRDTK